MDSLLDQLTPVERVALLPLRVRALDASSATPILADRTAAQVADILGLDLADPKLPSTFVLVHAVRAKTIDTAVRRFVAAHPDAVVVDLGCGLDTRRERCSPPPGVDWFDVDRPAVIQLREKVLPEGGHPVAADVTAPAWLHDLPRDRPAVVVTDGLMAILPGEAFVALARAVTEHFAGGEFTFNAYSRLALRNGRRLRGPLSGPGEGEGIDDPREPESWNARLALIEDLTLGRAPEVALFPPLLRFSTRLAARSVWMVRNADRVVRYRFPA